MTDDELVEHYFPARWFPYAQREVAKALAAAVREAVLKRVRVCDECVWRDTNDRLTVGFNGHGCTACGGSGILFGRGVTESET